MNKNSMNRIMLAGFIVEGPSKSVTSNGLEISSFLLSTEEVYKNKDGVMYDDNQIHRCVCFGKNAESANKYFGLSNKLLINKLLIN